MNHRYKVTDPELRKELIKKRVLEARTNGKVQKEFKFRGGQEPLPEILVPIELPVYRLENYRTRDRQLSLIARGDHGAGFFDASRTEDLQTQEAQHAILLKQSQEGSGETIKPIYDELGRVCLQTESLIISATGVVVNGNRRLAAMRDIHINGNARDVFKDVSCLVLPESATPDEVRELEIALQMQPETKLPYEWTALGRAVRDMRLAGITDEIIENRTNRSRQELDRAVKMIETAELYLDRWLSAPQDFDKLKETEQAFAQVATRNLSKQDDPQLRDATRAFDFFVIEHRDSISERAYKLINVIEANPHKFLSGIAEDLDIDLSPEAAAADNLEISFEDASEGTQGQSYAALLDALREARKSKEGAEEMLALIEEHVNSAAEATKARDKSALKAIKDAERKLARADINSADAETYDDIVLTLDRCIERIDRLRSEIEVLKASGGTE